MANERWHGIPLHGKLPCRQVCYDSSVCRVDSSFVKSIKSAGQEEQYATHGWWRRAPVAPAPDKSSATVPTPEHLQFLLHHMDGGPVPQCYTFARPAVPLPTMRGTHVVCTASTAPVVRAALQRAASPRHIDSEWSVLQCTIAVLRPASPAVLFVFIEMTRLQK
jgi:hypothetical protein